jgi:hypothetical protein
LALVEVEHVGRILLLEIFQAESLEGQLSIYGMKEKLLSQLRDDQLMNP